MLLEFACANHRSIRDEVLFSALAGKDNTYVDSVYDVSGIRVLKTAVIYGANGSGKSNFIDAIAFVKSLVINSMNHQPGQGIRQQPHKLDRYQKNSTYKIQFIVNEIRYAYGFTLNEMLVTEEFLYYFPNNRQTKIFERSGDGFTAGSKFRGKFSACKDVLKPNRLFLSCAANFSAVQEVLDAYKFFLDELVIYSIKNQDDWMKYSLYQMNRNPQMKAAVIAFLRELGTGIKDIQVTIDHQRLDTDELPPFLSDEYKAMLVQKDVDAITANCKYENFETDLLQEESNGIRKLFAMLCPLIDIMMNGKVLICDELEASLHESIVYGLVRLFIGTDIGKYSQLIFTTHDTGILNLDLFRRDQIWFTEMQGEERATDLYSLAEIRNVRKEDNFGRGYIAGKYGGIPMLNLDFANIVSQM